MAKRKQPRKRAESAVFDRLRGNAVLSTWRPSGKGDDMPPIPTFLLRAKGAKHARKPR